PTGLGSSVRSAYKSNPNDPNETPKQMPVPALYGSKIQNPDAVGVKPVVLADQYIGPVYPPRIIGLGSSLTLFRDFTLDAQAEHQGGMYLTNFIGYQNSLRNVWQPCYAAQQALQKNDISHLTALQQGKCAIDRTVANSDFWAEKADFIKLRSVTLSYNLPPKLLRGTKNATLSISGRNLWKS